MKWWIAVAATCAVVPSVQAEERWEFLFGGSLAGSETVEASAAGFSGRGSFVFQGATIETAYRIALDASGAPASYAFALTAGGAKAEVSSSAAQGSLTLTVSRGGTAAGSKAFPLSPSTVMLDNNAFGQYRQLARLLSPRGPSRVGVQMLVPQVLSLIALEAVRQPGTWRWTGGSRSGTAVQWELTSPTPLLIRVWQDLATGCILKAELPQAKTVLRLAGVELAADAAYPAARPTSLSAPVDEKDLLIVSGRFRMGAPLTRAGGAPGRLPGVLLVGGSGPMDRDGEVGGVMVYRDLAFGLVARGFAVLRFDKRTYAYRGEAEALDADHMGLREEYLDDAAAAFRLLAADPWVDSSRLSLNPGEPTLEKVIAEAEAAFAAFRSTGRMPGPVLGGSASYWQDVLAVDPIGIAARLPQDMLLLRGERDFQADASDLSAWQRGLVGRKNVVFVTLANLNHLLVDVPEGPSTGVEYYREGWVSPSAMEAVAAGLAR